MICILYGLGQLVFFSRLQRFCLVPKAKNNPCNMTSFISSMEVLVPSLHLCMFKLLSFWDNLRDSFLIEFIYCLFTDQRFSIHIYIISKLCQVFTAFSMFTWFRLSKGPLIRMTILYIHWGKDATHSVIGPRLLLGHSWNPTKYTQ